MHPRLTGVLRTINPLIPSDATPAEAWAAIKPGQGPYLRNSFWRVLSERMPFARTNDSQLKLAEYIWRYKTREEQAGRAWPPVAIKVKPAATPQPHTL